MSKALVDNKISKEFFVTLYETLASDPRSVHTLCKEVEELIPFAKDRQIYKLL